MSSDIYTSALKLAKRSYQSAISKGEYPYLPVLDDILSYTETTGTVNLGLIDIPLSRIVGTKTEGRSNAFAGNFMPLLPSSSEFAAKWNSVYNYQLDIGIQDPIVAYEFMNRFYVAEGNKRVSIMKYLDNYSIPGTVTRLLPPKTDDKESRLYYEFLDFYEVSKHCDIWFTKEGSYKKLLKLMGKAEKEEWTDDERISFRSAYQLFSKALSAFRAENKLTITISDAFLIYTEIYGYSRVLQDTKSTFETGLQKAWNEFELANKGNPVDLVPDPKIKKASLLDRIIPTAALQPEDLKIAFIYPKTIKTSGWSYSHELGRMHLEQAFNGRLKTTVFDNANTDTETEAAIEKAVQEGCNLIFTTAPQMINQSVRSAVLYPKVKIYNCSIMMSYSSVPTYYARMYESKFLIGAIAAALSRTDRLGYVADYPIYGTLANVNAFALGARMINPYVKVHLEWNNTGNTTPREKLEQAGIVFISDHDTIIPESPSREYGLYERKEDGTLENLATPIWHWGKFYEQIIKGVLSGKTESSSQKGEKAINYWWGMSAGVIEVICSKDMPHGTYRLINFLQNSICAGSFHPFDGPLYSQGGILRCEEGKSLTAAEIATMDWLAENVEGQIPSMEELTEEARTLVQVQGVKTDDKTK